MIQGNRLKLMEVNCILIESFIIYNGLGVVCCLLAPGTTLKLGPFLPVLGRRPSSWMGSTIFTEALVESLLFWPQTVQTIAHRPSAGRRILRQRVSGWNSMNLSNSQVHAFSQMGSLLSKLSGQTVSSLSLSFHKDKVGRLNLNISEALSTWKMRQVLIFT